MREEIAEAVAQLDNRYVRQWKKEGGKIVGYPCSFVPEEIVYAAGMLPLRLRAVEAVSTSIGDTYFGPVICSFPKCILQMAGEGRYGFLDGAVICNGCDSMRRLDECWRKAAEDFDGILPAFFTHFAVPHKVEPYSLKWFTGHIRSFTGSLERSFGVTVTDDDLHRAIREYNRGRKLLLELDALRTAGETKVSGAEATAVAIAASAMPRSTFNALLEDILGEIRGRTGHVAGKRILLAGSVIDEVGLLRLIEDAGAVVVADTLCFGIRSQADLVDEDGDPVEALARRYLDHSLCPRMFGYYKDRFGYIARRARETRVDGVILQNIRFCDLHGSENGIFERDLEAQGIPCMRMEREYGPLAEEGRIRMRLDAFLERLRG